MCFPGLTNTR
jgi:Xaa-Pro aminopeptidase